MKESREFFTETGQPENEEERAQREYREKSHREYRVEKKDKELEAILDSFDFELMRAVIAEDFMRSTGLPADKMNFIPQAGIDHDKSLGEGKYQEETNSITLSRNDIEQSYEGFDRELAVLLVALHEEGHAASRRECYGQTEKEKGESVIVQAITGYTYELRERFGDIQIMLYNAFEEGVNEKCAREWLKRYGERKGIDSAKLKDFEKAYVERADRLAYSKEVAFVDFLVQEISKATEIDERTAWEAIKQGKFSGSGFRDGEVSQGLKDIFGKEFMDRLADGNFKRIMEDIAAAHASRETPVKTKDKMLHFVKSCVEPVARIWKRKAATL